MNDLQGTPAVVLLWLLSGSGLATDNKLLVTNTSNLHGKAPQQDMLHYSPQRLMSVIRLDW
jgi:hypothetical protein